MDCCCCQQDGMEGIGWNRANILCKPQKAKCEEIRGPGVRSTNQTQDAQLHLNF